MRETMHTEFASRQTTVRRYLDEFRPWICSKLGCGMEETVLLELNFRVAQVAAPHVLAGVRLRSDDSRPIRELRKLVEAIELPHDSYPSFEVHLGREPRGRFANRRQVLEAEWQDGPVALWLRGFPEPVVTVSIPILQAGNGVEQTYDCVILRRKCAPAFLNLIEKISG